MSNLSYEMIEGSQAGGAYNGAHLGTAGGGAGGEESTLIPGDKPTRKAWMAAVGGMLLAGAFVGAFISSPRSSRTPMNPDAASSSAAGEYPQTNVLVSYRTTESVIEHPFATHARGMCLCCMYLRVYVPLPSATQVMMLGSAQPPGLFC